MFLGSTGDSGEPGDKESGECVCPLEVEVGLKNPFLTLFCKVFWSEVEKALPGRRSTAVPGTSLATTEGGGFLLAVSTGSFKWCLIPIEWKETKIHK